MSEDKAYQLACKLFNDYNYNGSQWEIDSQIDSYYNCLKSREAETGKEYDYDKMYRLIEKEYKYKTIPPKTELIKWQKRSIKYNYDNSKDGELVLFLCYKYTDDGHYHLKEIQNYTVSNNETTQYAENQRLCRLRNIYDEITVKHYKKDSCLIGDTVFIPKSYNEIGEVTEYEKEKIA